jgi:hypothetical protein
LTFFLFSQSSLSLLCKFLWDYITMKKMMTWNITSWKCTSLWYCIFHRLSLSVFV